MTTPGTATSLMTADDLPRLDAEGVRGELIRGVLRAMTPAGEIHGGVIMRLAYHLNALVIPGRLGRVVGSDSGILLERDPDTVREPDLSFTSAERAPLDVWTSRYTDVVPDLVVEVVSPSDDADEVERKALMWRGHGARLVWVVHPDPRTVEVYRADGTVETLEGDAALDGEDVLPGFTCPLASVFDA